MAFGQLIDICDHIHTNRMAIGCVSATFETGEDSCDVTFSFGTPMASTDYVVVATPHPIFVQSGSRTDYLVRILSKSVNNCVIRVFRYGTSEQMTQDSFELDAIVVCKNHQ